MIGLGLLRFKSNVCKVTLAKNVGLPTIISPSDINITTLVKIKKLINTGDFVDDYDLDNTGTSAWIIDNADLVACKSYLLGIEGYIPPKFRSVENA